MRPMRLAIRRRIPQIPAINPRIRSYNLNWDDVPIPNRDEAPWDDMTATILTA